MPQEFSTHHPGTNRHQSYLLRLWWAGSKGNQRALLQDVLTGERLFFPDLESLFSFLTSADCDEKRNKLESDIESET